MTTAEWTILLVAGIAVAHPFVMRVIMDAVQPLRLEMADLGRALIMRNDIPDHHKKLVASIVDDAFEWKFMILVFFVTPAFALTRLLRKPLSDPFRDIKTDEARKLMQRFVELFAKSTAAANPFFFILVGIEFLVLFGALRIFRVINGNSNSVRIAAQRVVLRAEERATRARAA